MGDDVTLPGTGKIVATEELAGNRHAQIVLVGGKPVRLVAMVTPATAGGYSAGEVIGDQVLITDVPTGVYAVRSVSVVSLDGTDVPTAAVAVYGNVVDSTPPTLDGDADTWTPDPLGGSGVLAVFASEGDAYAWTALAATTGPVRIAFPVVPLIVNTIGDGAGGVLADLSVLVVATETTVADLTGGLIVDVMLELVAATADVASYTSF